MRSRSTMYCELTNLIICSFRTGIPLKNTRIYVNKGSNSFLNYEVIQNMLIAYAPRLDYMFQCISNSLPTSPQLKNKYNKKNCSQTDLFGAERTLWMVADNIHNFNKTITVTIFSLILGNASPKSIIFTHFNSFFSYLFSVMFFTFFLEH